jgi:predicted nucleic acid-binding protein
MIGLPRRAFIDTSALVGLAVPRDRYHREATVIQGRLVAEEWALYTSNVLVVETHALLLARAGRYFALQVLQEIDRSSINFIRIDAEDEERGRAILNRFTDKDFSLADAISFAVMERLLIPYAFTFDRNFAQYGINVLRPA